MTSLMRAVTADPTAPQRVAFASVPRPEPAPDEVVVGVEAFSINRGETFLLADPRPGWRPGKDVAGTIVAVGAQAGPWQPGQRVVAHPEEGGWAQAVAVPVDRLALLPAELSTQVAATLGLAGLTALRLTRVTGPLAGRRVLLPGASGGVGHFFVELAAAHGALVTAISASPERGARLLALGAAAVAPDVEEVAGPFDVAIDTVGGPGLAELWARLTPQGLLVWAGQASLVAPTIDFLDWRGATSGTLRRFHYAGDPTSVADDLAALVRITAAGRLHPEVGFAAPWAQTADALAALLDRRVRGNVVLTVDPA